MGGDRFPRVVNSGVESEALHNYGGLLIVMLLHSFTLCVHACTCVCASVCVYARAHIHVLCVCTSMCCVCVHPFVCVCVCTRTCVGGCVSKIVINNWVVP